MLSSAGARTQPQLARHLESLGVSTVGDFDYKAISVVDSFSPGPGGALGSSPLPMASFGQVAACSGGY